MVERKNPSQNVDETADQATGESAGRAEPSNEQWEILAGHIEAFIQRWEADGFGPQPGEHLPAGPATFRRMALVELIKVDLEYRYNSDGPVLKLEDYLEEYPELGQPDGMPAELIHEEYHVRKSTGHEVTVDELLERFPDRTESIQRVFQLENTTNMEESAAAVEALEPGDHIDDFYLMSRLGSGAFGSVFLARQESMQRMVALKVSGDKGTEGQTLAQLDHPNIVRVHDQVRLPDQNLRLLYMQFAAGGTLLAVVRASRKAEHKTGRIVMECVAAALEHTGVLSSDNIPLKGGLADRSWPEVVCQLGMDLAHALEYAHAHNTLHRDVKPANVLLDANGTAKLADFNISFAAEVTGDAAASFGGSLAYMSPEQMRACHPGLDTSPGDLDCRSDIYSLGVMLWEVLYGHRPVDDTSASGTWTESLEGMIELRKEVPASPAERTAGATEQRLVQILCRCLMPDRAERYRHAGDLARELGLTLQPRVARLMQNSQTGWRKWSLTWPLIAFLIAAIGPHVPAAVFNFSYNDLAIKKAFAAADVSKFEGMVVAVNLIAFPLGVFCCILYCRPVIDVLLQPLAAVEDSLQSRLRAYRLSRFVTILGISEWLVAGLVYPLGLRLLIGELEWYWYLHFLGSLLICGLIAAAYPFFLTATLCLRAFLPALLRRSRLSEQDVAELHSLSTQSTWSLYLAGGVPAVGTMILLTTQEADDPVTSFPLTVLSVLGAVGFAFALSLAKSVQSDVEALVEVQRQLPTSQSDVKIRA